MLHRIILGHLLGDGHVTKHEVGNSYFVTHRQAAHHSMNVWTKKKLSDCGMIFSETYPKIRESGGNSHSSSFLRSGRSKFWSEIRDLWYPNGEKIVPREYAAKYMDELAFCLWFADDGDKQGRISADCFSGSDIEFLKYLVKDKFGIRLNQWHQTGRENHCVLGVPKRARKKVAKWYRNQVGVQELLYKFE
jgi:hypothetical protein